MLEISFTIPSGGSNVVKGNSVGSTYDPRLRLLFLDRKTHFPLWAFIENVQLAMLAGNRDKNFDQGMANLVNDLKKLAGRSTSAVDAAKK